MQVLEKLDAPGGRAYVHRIDGYTFDAGPTVITDPTCLDELFALSGRKLEEGLLNRVEAGIRAYDPCLSCSTHAVGQMPIQVDFIAPDGTMIKTLKRD